MIKIGDFARLSQVSVVTLRYYDETGLLKPVEVDAFTGYRFYSASSPYLISGIGLAITSNNEGFWKFRSLANRPCFANLLTTYADHQVPGPTSFQEKFYNLIR